MELKENGWLFAFLIGILMDLGSSQTGGDIRLTGYSNETKGRLEYYSDKPNVNAWVQVCDDNFGYQEAMVVCRELGFDQTVTAAYITNNPFGDGGGYIWDFGGCTGTEVDLEDCGGQESVNPSALYTSYWISSYYISSNIRGVSDFFSSYKQGPSYFDICSRSEEVGVNCVQPDDPVPELRLVGGTDRYSGRVEINMYGEWGTICENNFYNNAATVVCRQLGLPYHHALPMYGRFGQGTGPIIFDDLTCGGHEESINQCGHNEYPTGCTHSKDIGVLCSNTEPVHTGAIQTYDHEFESSGYYSSGWRTHRIFRIQEGAIVKFICPTDGQVGLNANTNDKHIDMFWDLGGVEIGRKGEPNGERPDGTRVKERFQMYQDTGLGFNGKRGKRLLTMTYTARKEDNLKTLSCKVKDEDLLDSVWKGSYFSSQRASQSRIRLLVLPGPTALRYKSLVTDKTWPGGFVGEIHIPIDSFYNSWKMVLKFPKDVFRLYAGNFNIAREPCLHDGSCTKSRRTWVIYNTYENRVLSPLKDLHLTFIADVSKKMKKSRALVADIKFYGYNKVFGSDSHPIWEPWE